MKQLLPDKIKINTEKRKPLNYIAAIKFLAMIKIIKWHVIVWKEKPIDWGARMCEILFIASGFLVGYNHYQRNMPSDYTTSFKYSYKHLRTFYPLEILMTIIGFFIKKERNFNLTDFEILISNFLLLDSWTRYSKLISSFNGISWFLSSLLFCYFLVPLLLKGIKNIKVSLILFLIVSIIRIATEEIIMNGGLNIFDAHVQRGPFIRLFEFYMGMLMIPTFFSFKYKLDKYRNNYIIKMLYSFIQLFFPMIMYYIMLKYNNILYRCYFVLIFCVFIFIIAYDYGFLSDLFSHKLCVKIMSCQMEMYLIQNMIHILIYHFERKTKSGINLNSEIKFFIHIIIIINYINRYMEAWKRRKEQDEKKKLV